jgi:tyrosinase
VELPEIDWKPGFNNWEGTNAAIQAHDWYKPKDGPDIPDRSIGDLVYRLLTKDYFKSWHTFSTTKYIPAKVDTWLEYLSLEYIHNNLHASSQPLWV